jgi:protein O-mannosyl-transferase
MSIAPSRPVPWICLALAALTLITFHPVLRFGFVNWDDMEHVARNPDMAHPTWEAVQRYWSKPYFGMWAPVTYTTWLATAEITNPTGKALNPLWFHLLNLALHTGAVIFVFLIILRLIPNPWPAAIGAAVFAVHPIQVEAVAWISGLRDLLAAFFSLMAIWVYLHGQRRNQIIATAIFILAILSKPTAVVTPIILAILLARDWRAHIRWLALWFAFAVAIVIIASLVQPNGEVFQTPIWARPIVAFDAIAFYAKKLLIPTHFLIDYGRTPDWLLSHPSAWLGAGIAAIITLAILAFRKKTSHIAMGAAITVAGLLPVLGLVPFDFQYYSTVADRYVYLAMLGVALVVADIVAAMPRGGWGFFALVLLWLSILCNGQVWVWRSTDSLCSHTLATNPQSVAALRILSFDALQDSDWQTALRFTDRALQTKPNDPVLLFDRGNALRDSGNLPEAAQDYALSLQHRPHDPQLRNNYAVVLARLGQDDAAEAQFAEVLRQAPNYANARANWATHLAVLGHRDQALAEFRRALQDDPNCVNAQKGIAALGFKN